MAACILGRQPGGPGRIVCSAEECLRCGFAPKVAAVRLRRIKAGELTANEYGVRRLVLDPETGK